MTSFHVYRTPVFEKKLEDFSDDFKEQIERFEDQLEKSPYVGKPLGVRWFREKKIGKYRIYYLIYEDLRAVYSITLSGKKDQQRVINTIRLFLDKYRKEIEDVVT
jgi:mRNA-degrading endonuclease RelE of RelBE toxin-antitoxin system